ncbi:hypothetical protein Aperf_G00000094506 [Anoplocephala perfoliata]
MTAKEFKLHDPSDLERGPFQASKADYEATRRRKALCLRNFMIIVERFALNPVTKEMIAIALPWLEREQFDDIPVERSGHKNCGYVLCQNSLPEYQFKQKYRISVARRRVYEIGDRKYFCSDWCYRASCYLRHQIPSDPVWCRSLPTGPMSNLKYLPANAPGRPGKTILDALANLRLNSDIENTGVKDEFSSSDEDSDFRTSFSAEDKSDKVSDVSSSDEDKEMKKLELWNEVVPHPKNAKIVERKIKVQPKSPNSQTLGLKREEPERTESDPKEAVLSRLREWLTQEAVEILYSEGSRNLPAKMKPSEYEKRVSAFLSQQPEEKIQEEDEEEASVIALPLVDSISQRSYRLRLLMDSLMPNMKNILFRMEVSISSVYDKMENFIAHFQLTNKNLHILPKELNLMCYSLLHLFSANDENLIPHDQLVAMLAGSFNGDKEKAEEYLAKVMEIANKLHEESLDMPF